MSRGIAVLSLLVICAGCAGLNVPSYIQAESPYKRVYYGEFQSVLDEVRTSLGQEGWHIAKEVDPALYERNPLFGEGDKNHVLIFTDVRKSQRIIYTEAKQLNVYVSLIKEGVEVDVRFRSIKNFYLFRKKSFSNPKSVKRLLDRIEQRLLTAK